MRCQIDRCEASGGSRGYVFQATIARRVIVELCKRKIEFGRTVPRRLSLGI